jgi:hypothetical protein
MRTRTDRDGSLAPTTQKRLNLLRLITKSEEKRNHDIHLCHDHHVLIVNLQAFLQQLNNDKQVFVKVELFMQCSRNGNFKKNKHLLLISIVPIVRGLKRYVINQTGAVFTVAAKKAAFFKASLFSRSSSVFTVIG